MPEAISGKQPLSRRNYIGILLIVLGAIGVRLVLIQQPFVDQWSWRQSDVAAIARNFLQNGFRFAYPQIDWAGNEPGYVGTEFPLLPFSAAIAYEMLGVHEWIGRAQSLCFFIASLPFYYLLVRRVLGSRAALWALGFYSFAPLCIMASREFMPDIPSLSLSIIGLCLFLEGTDRDRGTWLVLSAVTISLSILVKLPTAVIGAPMFYVAYREYGAGLWRKRILWGYALVALVPSMVWYWHAHKIAETYYPYHFFGGGGLKIMSFGWYWKLALQTATSTLTPVVFLLAAAGCFLRGRGKHPALFLWWLAAMTAFIFIVGYGNRHQWYQLPLVPIAGALAGLSLSVLETRCLREESALAMAVVLLLVTALAYYYCRPFYTPNAEPARRLGLELRKLTPPGALIVAADTGDPTVFYYAERKGWHFVEDGLYQGEPKDSAEAVIDLEKLRGRGANYLVFTNWTSWWLEYYTEFSSHLRRSAKMIEQTPDFVIFQLDPIPGSPR